MKRSILAGAILITTAFMISAVVAAPVQKAPTCAAQLKDAQAAKALADVKLEEENERADAQVYLTRLELSVTKKKLADTLAKCGAACAPPASPVAGPK